MDYKAGNLELSILGFSEKAVNSVNVTEKALRRLASAVDKINNTQFVFAGQKLEVLFTKIAQATNSINTTNITNLASAAKSLSSISRLSSLEKMDFDKVGKGFNTLSTAIDPFLQKIKSAETSLNSLYGILSKVSGKKNQGLLDVGSSSRKSSSFNFLNIAKWSGIIYAGRRLGRVVANIAQSGADYTETLNLWQVAMGKELLPQSEEFIEKLNEAYGISEKTLMNAQATFKNMLGGLGQISDEMAYKLSEGITQMALDYASLYNVQFDQAFTKFQAALAGQVRPIRSVSGYDITENTLFQLYQELGGTKTMRQLSRTEKQLLSILAVFQQMDNTGAVGDLKKTIDSFANQSRVTADSWDRILTFAGAILTNLIDSSGLLVKFNAVLIFIGDTLKAIGEGMGALEGVPDPFANATEGAEDLIEKTNEAYGLLDFDKIRALGGSEQSDLGIDKSILTGFEQYTSILEEARNSATELANTWKVASGLFDENGVFNKDRWDEITESITNVGIAIGIVFGVNTVEKITNWATSIDHAKDRAKLLDEVLTGLAIYAFAEAIQAFQDGDYALGILATAFGVATLALQLLNTEFGKTLLLKIPSLISNISSKFSAFGKTLQTVNGFALFAVGTLSSFTILDGIFSNLSEEGKQLAGVLAIILGTIVAIAGAIQGGLIGATVAGLGVGAVLAGIKATADGFGAFAEGGLPDKGTMFYAGEAGAEIVYNTPSGQSGVANVQQIAQATYAGTTQALNDWWGRARGDMPQFAPASDSGLYERVTAQAGLRGDHWSR